MALNRIEGDEELYVGGIWALKRPSALEDRRISHVLSVVRCTPSENWGQKYRHHVIDVDDVEDEDLLYYFPQAVRFIESAVHPKESRADDHAEAARNDQDGNEGKKKDARNGVNAHANGEAQSTEEETVEFHQKAKRLRAAAAAESDLEPSLVSHADPSREDPDAIQPAPLAPDLSGMTLADPATLSAPGAVFVHCAMGKSRSVAVVAAYLLWKYPARFGRASHANAVPALPHDVAGGSENKATRAAVEAAITHIRRTREIAEPNDGFVKQLQMWWDMGCPADEGRLEVHPAYQKWCYRREVEESLAVGEAPGRLRFEDEERAKSPGAGANATDGAGSGTSMGDGQPANKELRCKKCRRVLATSPFIVDHQPPRYGGDDKEKDHEDKEGAWAVRGGGQGCQHLFIEPLSWMRKTLESGELEGRLACPTEKCGASLGRYSWRGFRCTCGAWVTPAFSLARGRVDEVTMAGARGRGGMEGSGSGSDGDAARSAARAAFGIRMPPGSGSTGRL